MERKKCQHNWAEVKNDSVCSKCGKRELFLRDINKQGKKIEGLLFGIKSDGSEYTVRTSRHRYFYPDEWGDFISRVADTNKIIFDMLLFTGARIQEAMMIKKRHINLERKIILLFTTKIKSKKQERRSKQRELKVSKLYIRQIKKFTESMKEDDYIFLNNIICKDLETKEVKKIAHKRGLNVFQMFKRALNKTNIPDKFNFSLHNIRKTNGMWLKCLNVKSDDICFKLGHTRETYLMHYGSADVFSQYDRRKIENKFEGMY